MFEKNCGYHKYERRKLFRRIFASILAFIILILLVIFLIWIILRPTKPRFVLQDATVYAFNLSSSATEPSPTSTSNTLSINMQVSLSAHNPNDRIGVYYQNLDVYASYRGQQISLTAQLPPTYQGHNDLTLWSPFLYGTAVPVSPFLLNALQQDQNAGGVLVKVKLNGRVKWKVGTWVSGGYHIYVDCPAYIRLTGDRNNGTGVAGQVVKLSFYKVAMLMFKKQSNLLTS